MRTVQCFRKDDHDAHVWGQYSTRCVGLGHAAVAAERALATARVSAYLGSPSWSRPSYLSGQAHEIVGLILDAKSCGAERVLPGTTMQQVCYREQNHHGSHFADGNYAWDTAEIEQRRA